MTARPDATKFAELDTELLLKILSTLERMEHRLSDISASQAHLDAAVATLTTFVQDVEAEVAALKAANPTIDFTALDALVATATADDPGPQPTPAPAPAAPVVPAT